MIATGAVVAERSGVSVPGVDPARVRFRRMPTWLADALPSRVRAITLRRTVLVHRDIFEEVVSGAMPELVAHELIHVRQWLDEGVVRFTARYVADYLVLRALGCRHDDAYRHIRFEWAAYSGAAHIVARR